jgi:ABC-type sugar transport system ATPase subunit
MTELAGSPETTPVVEEVRTESPLLSVRHLTKSYGAVRAVDDVTLDVLEHEVLGIVGDNGAGKSTFISLLIGAEHADSGEIYFHGQSVHVSSPTVSRQALGIEVIFQDLALAPDLTVWENLYLGQELHHHRFFLDRATMRARSDSVLQSLGTKIRATDLVNALSGGERQLTAVARALLFDRDILLMDEPTAAVSAAKAEDVLQLIEKLKSRGKTIVLISHRLEDVLRVCGRVAIFVNGRLVYVKPASELDVGKLAHLMFETKIGEFVVG